VLDKARAMEKWAKSPHGGNRNAFALCVIKKSGESHEACYPWALDADMKHWKALEALVSYFEDGYCSENFVRTLSREFSLLQDDDGNITDKGMVAIELQRLVKRSLTEKGVKTVGMAEKILQAVKNLMITIDRKVDNNFKLELLTEAISITLFIKRNRNKKTAQIQ
jgi:CRISPR-associated protein Cmr2